MVWKTGNMLRPAARGVCVSIVSWKLTLCVGSGLRNPDSPFKLVPVRGEDQPFALEQGTRQLWLDGTAQAPLRDALSRRELLIYSSSQDLWMRAGKKVGLASGLSQGQPEGLSFPQ